jgi:molybdate transport system ATP-binding protein
VTETPAHLSARVQAGIVAAQLALDAATVAVLGPNASGKTTMLRALAGLIPNHGEVVIAGRDVSRLPPAQRRVGYVPQDLSLFAHLDVLGNVGYGVRSAGRSRAEARQVAGDWLDRLGIAPLAGRRPGQLSGGQAQRVALARALATDPALLLLDEPLSALDVAARAEVRAQLREHLSAFGGTSLVVSHDPADAWALADHVLVLEDGRVVQQGRFSDVAERPASPWLAQLLGLNAWTGAVSGTTVRVTTPRGDVELRAAVDQPPAEVTVTVPPARVRLDLLAPGDTGGGWLGQVAGLERHGDRLLVHVEGAVPVTAEVATGSSLAGRLRPGVAVGIRVEPHDVTLAPRGPRDTLGPTPDTPRPQEDDE